MVVKSLNLNGLRLNSNIFLAPMAGYTDFSYRYAVKDFGYGLRFTELVSAKGLFFGGENTKSLLRSDDYETTAAQIFGGDPYYMRLACESEALSPFKVIDINMGCPVPKVYKNGEGSALLGDIHRAERVIKECVKSGKTITVKIRTGLKEGDDFATEFSKMSEDAGAKLITIHGRVRENYYSGTPDYKAIERAKKSVNIPIIANGGIFSPIDAEEMIDKTGADGIMLARGSIDNPFLPLLIRGERPPLSIKEFMLLHIDTSVKEKGERRAVTEFRKFIPCYLKGITGIKDIKSQMLLSLSADFIKEKISEIFG